MIKFGADYIFTGKVFIKEGVIICDDDGTILSMEESTNSNGGDIEIYEGILCPGFINGHCHLELSYMLGRIPEKKGLVQFIRDLLSIRNEKMDIVLAEIERAPLGDIAFGGHAGLQLLYAERLLRHPRANWIPRDMMGRQRVELVFTEHKRELPKLEPEKRDE